MSDKTGRGKAGFKAGNKVDKRAYNEANVDKNLNRKVQAQLLEDKTGAEHIIEIKDLCKSFDDNQVLKNITFYIRNNEFITLLGPSGCGKSTTLRIIAGFETADSGIVNFEKKDLLKVPAHKRQINTVFQRYALFPHLNVFDNVAFGLHIKKVPAAEVEERVQKALATVGLAGYGKRYIDQLSGGQMQRVAIARAIINRPRVLLLDEPLGALDLKMRKEMQIELKEMQRELGITFVYVTHDQEEALTMSDTIIVMKDGVIQQIGTPIDIYNEPRNAYVADFIGESNIIPGEMSKDFEVAFAGHKFECVDKLFAEFEVNKANPVDVVVRPEDIYVKSEADDRINGTVESIVFKGVHYEIMVKSDNGVDWMIHDVDPVVVGQRVGLTVDPDDIHIMRKSQFSPDPDSFGVKGVDDEENGELSFAGAVMTAMPVDNEFDEDEQSDLEDNDIEGANARSSSDGNAFDIDTFEDNTFDRSSSDGNAFDIDTFEDNTFDRSSSDANDSENELEDSSTKEESGDA